MVKLQVSDMRCKSCVHNIEDAIKARDAEVKISADLKKGQIEVSSKLEIEVLLLLIQMSGF